MKTFINALFVLLLTCGCFAQSTCLVTITEVRWRNVQHGGINGKYVYTPADRFTEVRYQNTGDKEIRSVTFDVSYIDALGNVRYRDVVGIHQGTTQLTDSKRVKVGEKRRAHFDDTWNWNNSRGGLAFRVNKVMFSDGTTWANENPEACSMTHMEK